MFETHAHLTDSRYKPILKDVISRAVSAGVTGIITIHGLSEDEEYFRRVLACRPFIYGAAGVHPGDIRGGTFDENTLSGILSGEKMVALGETGLDYHYKDNPPRDIQVKVFRRQLELAHEKGLPAIIHIRDAWQDAMEILAESGSVKGVMHCFSGDADTARRCLELGLYISFAGPVTYPKSERACEAVRSVPKEKLLLETDCPYLSPQEVRGTLNEPANIRYTFGKVAQLRGMPLEDLVRVTTENAKRLFGIQQ